MREENELRPIPRQTLARLPEYAAYLKSAACGELASVSAGRIAAALGKSEIQVRKDLSAVSTTGGRPKVGFEKAELIRDIDACLGLNRVDGAALVGVGRLGTALLHYDGFKRCGVELVVAFERDAARAGEIVNGVMLRPLEEMPSLCRRLGVHIGVIAVPAEAAQQAADALVQAGVLAIWNFAPARLQVPENILVQNEDMACSLALLSHHLAQRLREEKP